MCGFGGGIRCRVDFFPRNNSCLNIILCVAIISLIFVYFILNNFAVQFYSEISTTVIVIY